MQTGRTNLTICWWKRLAQTTLLSKFKNIDYVTANQPKSNQKNNNQTITYKKKSNYAYLKIEPIARQFLKYWTSESLWNLFAFRFEKSTKMERD